MHIANACQRGQLRCYRKLLLPWQLRILFLTLLTCIAPNFCAGRGSMFSPQDRAELKDAVTACLKSSLKGDCSKGPNGPIRGWDVSDVIDMGNMFAHARSFNGDISKWDVSRVTNMEGMFSNAESFNGDLSKWDVSSVIDMNNMFANAKRYAGRSWFGYMNGISKWDVSRVTNMREMFSSAEYFNGDISKWDVSRVTNMQRMFMDATAFNGDISKWDVSSLTSMEGMFWSAKSFNGDISKWDVSRVTDMQYMFRRFALADLFESDISKWAKLSVPNTNSMFWTMPSFNGDISKWDVSSVINMNSMFWSATSFNGDISKWDVSSVTDMSGMFRSATSFNGDISRWDVSRVTAMQFMFALAKLFNSDISKWDVSSVSNTAGMFYSVASYNHDISKWDVSRITDMEGMFWSATSFNGDICKWDVSRVTDMNCMFRSATSFNSDISAWDVSRVTTMQFMFSLAKSFNSDISEWDVWSVTDMNSMFRSATSFKQKLCGEAWVNSKASKKKMFRWSSGSISRTVCTAEQYVSRRPITNRELIVRVPTTTSLSTPAITSVIGSMTACSTCGTFKRSGRVSCCAPGGAWYKSCGAAGSINVDHRWSEGMKACTPTTTTTTIRPACATCGTIRKSGKMSCCGRGGSWFGNCGGAGSAKVEHTWYEGIQACKARGRSEAAMGGQQLRVDQHQTRNEPSNGIAMARTSIIRYTVTNTSKAIAAATAISTLNSVNMSTPTIPPTDSRITTPTKRTNTTLVRASKRNTLADTVTTTPSSPASTGTCVTIRAPNKSLNIFDYIYFLLMIACWY